MKPMLAGGAHGGDARVHIYVVVDGQIVVAVGGDGDAPLAQDGVDKPLE
jgi:hypothetical protein